jgi:hypothetical protein
MVNTLFCTRHVYAFQIWPGIVIIVFEQILLPVSLYGSFLEALSFYLQNLLTCWYVQNIIFRMGSRVNEKSINKDISGSDFNRQRCWNFFGNISIKLSWVSKLRNSDKTATDIRQYILTKNQLLLRISRWEWQNAYAKMTSSDMT